MYANEHSGTKLAEESSRFTVGTAAGPGPDRWHSFDLSDAVKVGEEKRPLDPHEPGLLPVLTGRELFNIHANFPYSYADELAEVLHPSQSPKCVLSLLHINIPVCLLVVVHVSVCFANCKLG